MRIQFLLTQDINSPSGLGRYFPLAKELVNLGHEVFLVGLNPDYEHLIEKRFFLSGVDVWYVSQMHVQKIGNNKIYFSSIKVIFVSLKAAWELSKTVIKLKADVVIIAKPHPMNSIAGLVSILRKQHVFLDCDDHEQSSSKYSSGWQRKIVGLFERAIPHFVKAISTNTLFTMKRLKDDGIAESKIYYLPNGIDLDRIIPSESKLPDHLRAQYKLERKKVIAFIGSLAETSHPISLLIEAFKIIHTRYPDVVLLIVGGGEDFETYHKIVNQNNLGDVVIFTGRISPNQVFWYYKIADAVVDPVIDNNASRGRSPLKLFESWACGIPFITGDVGDRSSLVGNPPAGMIVKSGDVNSLASGIELVLQNPPLAKSFTEEGNIKLRQYTWKILAERYYSFISGYI